MAAALGDDLDLVMAARAADRSGAQGMGALALFLRHLSQVLSRTQILNRVWDYGSDPGSNVVDVYVGYLRREINPFGLPQLIQTVRGAGYRLLPPAQAAPPRP